MELRNDPVYKKDVDEMIDYIIKRPKQEIAGEMDEMLNFIAKSLRSDDEDVMMLSLMFLHTIRGYINSHIVTENPSQLQIAGRVMYYVDQYMETLSKLEKKK